MVRSTGRWPKSGLRIPTANHHGDIIESWHFPCILISAGDFRAQFDTQRRPVIIFRSAALCLSDEVQNETALGSRLFLRSEIAQHNDSYRVVLIPLSLSEH